MRNTIFFSLETSFSCTFYW